MRANRELDLRPFYALLVGVGAIVAHIASEFAAMGSDADSVLFSARHLYLGLAAVIGTAVFIIRMRALLRHCANGRDFKRALSVGMSTLPFRGQGARFFGLTAALQFGIGMLTEVGEGAPIAGHDVAAGVLGAFVVVVALAFVAKAIGASLPTIAEVVASWFAAPSGALATQHSRRAETRTLARQIPWFPQLFNRPPPSLRFA